MSKAKKMSLKTKIIIVVSVFVVVVVAALAGIGNFLVTYAIGRGGDGGNRQVALKVDDEAVETTKEARTENYSLQAELTAAFMAEHEEQKVSITSDDGLKLNGGYYAQPDSHRWAIVIHGYRSRHEHMVNFAQRYFDAGYHVLAPDLRACGESEGSFVGMGWPDRKDMLRWMDWILAQDAQAEIVLHGVSMGGATVMMTSGEQTPDAVKAFVEDCGYTSVWDIFSSELDLRFHLPAVPVLSAASVVSSLRAGYSFTEASSVAQVAKCEKPMLFIHGDQDNFVPFSMMDPVYNAKPGDNKEKVVVPGAGHGLASTVMGEQYWETVFAFLEKYL